MLVCLKVLLDKKKFSYLLLLAENKKKPSLRKLLSMTVCTLYVYY